MEIGDLYRNELSTILIEEGFVLKEDGGGYIATMKYKLGNKVMFFETSKKTQDSFRVGISVRITNLPVEKIHSLVNNKNAGKSIISFKLSHLASRYSNREANFERKKFDGELGNVISKETLPQYKINLKSCLRTLILPFFENFNDQSSFYKWLNEPVLDGEYDFEMGPVWKDAINSLIISKLVCSKNFEILYKKWLGQELPKGPGFDTREELIHLKEILSSNHPA